VAGSFASGEWDPWMRATTKAVTGILPVWLDVPKGTPSALEEVASLQKRIDREVGLLVAAK